jgi:hypothetical protein
VEELRRGQWTLLGSGGAALEREAQRLSARLLAREGEDAPTASRPAGGEVQAVDVDSQDDRQALGTQRAPEGDEPRGRPALCHRDRPGCRGQKTAQAVRWERQPVAGPMLTHPGVYCLRINEMAWDAERLWRTYVTLTDLEAVFRSLKSELGLCKAERARMARRRERTGPNGHCHHAGRHRLSQLRVSCPRTGIVPIRNRRRIGKDQAAPIGRL